MDLHPAIAMLIIIAGLSVLLLSAPLTYLFWIGFIRKMVTMKRLYMIVSDSEYTHGRSRLDTLNDLSNIQRHSRDPQMLRSYMTFLPEYSTIEIYSAHKSLLDAGVKSPSTHLTEKQVAAARDVIEALREQELPSVEWEHHPLTAYIVSYPDDKDNMVSIIRSGRTDHQAVVLMLNEVRKGGPKALLDGFL